ncbi:MAG: DNA methyltransferase [Patescibacteria group bacterium]|jgi:tRNA G10  N-methylase Trm11
MKYFFILGKNPTLSLAEIAVVLNLKPEQILFLSEKAAVIEISAELDAKNLIKKVGGTIKIGVINDQLSMTNFQSMANFLMANIKNNNTSGKFNFGFSYYGPYQTYGRTGKHKKFDEKKIGMEIKSELKEQGINSRWVTSKEEVLSSVVVEQNKLTTEQGKEIVIIDGGQQQYAGHTIAVQPFKDLSKRDYGRPGRDDFSGMLPPKLAQILINLAVNTDGHRFITDEHRSRIILLDPFCGSGTILTEAALMGYQKLIGCDASQKAVEDTRKNFQFTISNFQSIFNKSISNDAVKLFQCKVENLNQKVKLNSVNVIVTEPYLGPSRKKNDKETIKKIIKELEELYYQAIKQFEKALKNNGRVAMIWPVFKARDTVFLSAKNILGNSNFKIVNPLPNFGKENIIKLTNRNTIVYGREGQRVWREVIILEKR